MSAQGADVSGPVKISDVEAKSGSASEIRAASAEVSGTVGAKSGEAGLLNVDQVGVGAGLLAAPVLATPGETGGRGIAGRLSGFVEEQKMFAEMHPNSNRAVFMRDMAAVKEKAVRGREILSKHSVEGVRDSLRASAPAQPTSTGRKIVVGAKTIGKAALTGADRFARLPSVAVSGVKTVGKAGLGVAGAGAKAAAATVAGSLIPGVGMFAGPAMGVNSLRKSMSKMSDGLRERSVKVRKEHAAWLEEHGLGVVGVPDARRVDGGPAGGVGGEAEKSGGNAAKQGMDSPDVKSTTPQETAQAAPKPDAEPKPVTEEKAPNTGIPVGEKPRNIAAPEPNTTVREKTGTVSHDSSNATATVTGFLGDMADTHQEKKQRENAQIQAHMDTIAAQNSGKQEDGKPRAQTMAEAMTGVAQADTDTTDQTLRRQQTEIENTKQALANQKIEMENDAKRLAQETQASATNQVQDAPPIFTPPTPQTPQAPSVETAPVAMPVVQTPAPQPPVGSVPQSPEVPTPQPTSPTTQEPQTPNLPLSAQPEPPRFMSRRGRHHNGDDPIKGAGEKTSKPQA